MPKLYELLEHTADIAIRVKGGDLKEIFSKTAGAIFDIMAEDKGDAGAALEKAEIKQSAGDLQELFVNWLNELLSLSAANGIIFYDFRIGRLDENNIVSTAFGRSMKGYKVNLEIKAATYHQLKIEKTGSGWQAEVIFDV
ncbi:MAG: archease [Candidatus Omnitrophota bacterium]